MDGMVNGINWEPEDVDKESLNPALSLDVKAISNVITRKMVKTDLEVESACRTM